MRRSFKRAGAVATALMALAVGGPTVQPADAVSAIYEHHGFDTCAAPSSASMDAWWPGTPLEVVGIYFGGDNRGCAQPNLTAAWVTHQQQTGWGLLPIWFGPQMGNPSCTNMHIWNSNISTNTTTAYNQGYAEAQKAYTAAVNLGFSLANMPIVYDLEAYSGGQSSTTTCRNAAKSFIKGWADYLAQPTAQLSGVYGSACGSHIDDFASNGNPPDFIWFADWVGTNPSTSVVSNGCIGAGHWVNHQRHKQYQGPHNETHGGVTIHIDSDCSNGPVYATTARLDPGSDCL